MARSLIAMILAAVILSPGSFANSRAFGAPGPLKMLYEGEATVVSEYRLNLLAGETLVFQTVQVSTNGDPVLHLFDPISNSEVAVDDNGGGGKSALLTYTPAKSGPFILIVRARNQEGAGTTNLSRNGSTWQQNVQFGGWHIWMENLRAKEVIDTLRLPNGAGPWHAIYILKPDGIGFERRLISEISDPGVRYNVLSALGSRWIIVAAPYRKLNPDGFISVFSSAPGLVRIVRNDAGLANHDLDADGLGNELEAQLDTCSSLSGFAGYFDCSKASDPRDTDGDGIPDGWEALGRRDMTPFQLLPLWGASPIHKDLFIEVDFMRRCKWESDDGVADRMPSTAARSFAEVYADGFTKGVFLKGYHASILRNPDLQPGINVHLDIGRPPGTLEDAAIYGDWGGYTAVNPVKSSSKGKCEKEDGDYWVGVDPNSDAGWRKNMAPVRRGIFRYALGVTDGGGQSGIGYFAAFYNFNLLRVPAHETGHTLGLSHSGVAPAGRNPDVDPNCKPNYASIMSYAFQETPGIGFSDGRTQTSGPRLNNWSLRERGAVDPQATGVLDLLANQYRYWVDRENGHVDWNRDGYFAPVGWTVRAYANYKPGSPCEYTRYNQTRVSDATIQNLTPSLARLGNRLYLFYVDRDGWLKYSYSTSQWNCPEPKRIGCGGGSWVPTKALGMESSGVDAERVRAPGTSDRILVVSVDRLGRLWERRLEITETQQEVWSVPVQIPGLALSEPSLARIDNGFSAYLAYRGPDRNVRINRLVTATGWTGEQLARDSSGNPIEMTSDWTSPSILQTRLPYKILKGLYGAFVGLDRRLDIWWFDPGTQRWEKASNVLESRPGPIYGRPAMMWVPYKSGSEFGRLYFAYVQYPSANPFNGALRMMMSYVQTPPNKKELLGLNSPFDNEWLYAFGIDLLFEDGKDSNLRAAYTSFTPGQKYQVIFRPKADGINDFEYGPTNDWEVLRVYLCSGVVNPGGLVANPIKCPARTW